MANYEFLANFPYDVRLLEKGAFVECLRQEGTLGLTYEGKFVSPSPTGVGLPCATSIYCRDDTSDFNSVNLIKASVMACGGLDSLPDLGYKFVLTYNSGLHIFDCCFLITTKYTDWYQKYLVLWAGSKGV